MEKKVRFTCSVRFESLVYFNRFGNFVYIRLMFVHLPPHAAHSIHGSILWSEPKKVWIYVRSHAHCLYYTFARGECANERQKRDKENKKCENSSFAFGHQRPVTRTTVQWFASYSINKLNQVSTKFYCHLHAKHTPKCYLQKCDTSELLAASRVHIKQYSKFRCSRSE